MAYESEISKALTITGGEGAGAHTYRSLEMQQDFANMQRVAASKALTEKYTESGGAIVTSEDRINFSKGWDEAVGAVFSDPNFDPSAFLKTAHRYSGETPKCSATEFWVMGAWMFFWIYAFARSA